MDAQIKAFRNHAANDDTFLAYLALSYAVAITGILVAQMSMIDYVDDPEMDSRLRAPFLGKLVSCFGQGTAIFTTLVGCYRFFQKQRALDHGHVMIGGCLLPFIGVLVGVVSDLSSSLRAAMLLPAYSSLQLLVIVLLWTLHA